MKFTLNWLKSFLKTNASLDEISETLTMIGLEVEKIEDKSENLKDFEVAQIIEASPHPDADKLQICKVKTKNETLQIVCGAKNARAGINVILAPVGSIIPTNNMKIKKSKIRGVESLGMLCSASELGVGEDDNGIMEFEANDNQIGEKFSKIAGLDDVIIEIAITPNRGDCLGVYGIARDLAAAGLGDLRPLTIDNIEGGEPSKINVAIENNDLCPLFAGRTFANLNNCDSPKWLKDRLSAIGVNPISAIVDVTNYISYCYGQPMHAYDLSKISGNLTARNANNNEKITALNDKEYSLSSDMLVIADDNEPQAIAGIIGGLASSCDKETANIFLEVAAFDAINIAKTGRKLELLSDSRYRFERGVDKEFSLNALNIATKMILDICGGTADELVKAGDEKVRKTIIDYDFDLVKKRIAIDVSKDESIKILQNLGFEVNENKITVPSFRSDVKIKEDIVEEIVRIYGYDNIPTLKLPNCNDNQNIHKNTYSKQQIISDSLINKGFDELVTWSFINDEKSKLFADIDDNLRLKNAISVQMNYMRPSILPNLLDAVAKNVARGEANLAFFETGLIYKSCVAAGQINSVAGLRSGNNLNRNIHESTRVVDVFDAKSDILFALDSVNVAVDNLQISTDTPSYYHPNRSGVVKLGKNILGYFGEIHPKIFSEFDIKQKLVAFEIFSDQINLKKKKTTAKPKLELNDLQNSSRDFAFIIDEKIAAQDILKAVKSSDKKFIKEVNIFDIYSGDKIDEGKKSVALSVDIEPQGSNLTEGDLVTISDKIIANVQKVGGILRQ